MTVSPTARRGGRPWDGDAPREQRGLRVEFAALRLRRPVSHRQHTGRGPDNDDVRAVRHCLSPSFH